MRRFHPVELGILSLTSLLLVLSIYQFMRETPRSDILVVKTDKNGLEVRTANRAPANARSVDASRESSEKALAKTPSNSLGHSSGNSSGNLSGESLVDSDVLHVELGCNSKGEITLVSPAYTIAKNKEIFTKTSRVRIVGRLCGILPSENPVGPGEVGAIPVAEAQNLKPQIENLSNEYGATVFLLVETQEFSSDYIPLQGGENRIQVLQGKNSLVFKLQHQ